MDDVLLRTTFIVEDMEAAIDFYTGVFGWTVAYDTVLNVDMRFPPAAPDGARSRLVIFQAEDPEIGGLGFMKYLDHPIAQGPSRHRPRLGQGEAILVIRSRDPDAIHAKIEATDAVIHAPPTDWTVPGPKPGQIIKLRTMSLFDPNGIYIEVNLRYPDEADG
jgi:catechol 2,3-dioxygenase-like lactoylglutathione lyase family enzyme